MKNLIIILALTFISFFCNSQSSEIIWERCYSRDLGSNVIINTKDNGFIIDGILHWEKIIKLNSLGDSIWSLNYNDLGDGMILSIIETADTNYVFCGSSHGDSWVGKISKTGELIWEETYGGSENDWSRAIVEVDDGFVLTGHTNSNDGDVSGNHGSGDAWVIKINNQAELEWQRCYGGSDIDGYGMNILGTNNQSFLLVGTTYSNDGDISGAHGSYDFFVMEIDSVGNILWQKCFGGSMHDGIYRYKQTPLIRTFDGNYVFGGYTSSNDGDVSGNDDNRPSSWIVKINETGDIIWQTSLNKFPDQECMDIIQTYDSNLMVLNYAESGVYNPNVWLTKLSSDGQKLCEKFYGSDEEDLARSIVQSSDSNLVITGESAKCTPDINKGKWTFKVENDTCSILPNKIHGTATYGCTPADSVLVQLTILNENGLPFFIYDSTFTDENGYYEFTNLPVGEYRIQLYNDWNDLLHPTSYTFEHNAPAQVQIQENSLTTRNIKISTFGSLSNVKPGERLILPHTLRWKPTPYAKSYSVLLSKYALGNNQSDTLLYHSTQDTFATIAEPSKYGDSRLYVIPYDSNGCEIGKTLYFINTLNEEHTVCDGVIEKDTIWNDVAWVKSDIDVLENATLSIKPGTDIYIDTVDCNGKKSEFGIEVLGAIDIQGAGFYSLQNNYRGITWKGIKIHNSDLVSNISGLLVRNAENALELHNSNISTLPHLNLRFNKNALKIDNCQPHVFSSLISEAMESDYTLEINNNSNPTFDYCRFALINNDVEFAQLNNNSNDISASSCRWYIDDDINIPNEIFDYYDDNSLGEFIYEPTLNYLTNLTKGAENYNIEEKSMTFNGINILGEQDNIYEYLPESKPVILDMGFEGGIINSEGADISIISRPYKNNSPFVGAEIYVSPDPEGPWELLGLTSYPSAYDIDGMKHNDYRYIKLLNIVPEVKKQDSLGVMIDAVISIHDTPVLVSLHEDFEESSFNVNNIKCYPNPSSASCIIEFYNKDDTPCKISVYNTKGKLVDVIKHSNPQKGPNRVKYKTNKLNPGLYFIQIKGKSISDVEKLLVL